MKDNSNLTIGQRVTYVPFEGCDRSQYEHGMIKSTRNTDFAFVVFNCDNSWANFQDYTGQLTMASDLREGWL